jgi:hypothetical protein
LYAALLVKQGDMETAASVLKKAIQSAQLSDIAKQPLKERLSVIEVK